MIASVCEIMRLGALGLEPRTHGLKGHGPESVYSGTDKTCEGDSHDVAVYLATILREHSDLAPIVDAWPVLPEPVRAGIVAMVKAATSRDE